MSADRGLDVSLTKQSLKEEATEQDFYMDGPYCVFTAAFHLKRGFCCGSGCRHCPYRDKAAAATILQR